MARRIYNANVRAYDTLVADVPGRAPRPALRIHGLAVLRAGSDRPRCGPAAGGLVRPDVDKYNTARALPRPRRCPAGPHRGPRRRRRGCAGRRARPGPRIRHQPGDRAPRARPVAPGGPGHEPPGRGLVRGRRPGPPAAWAASPPSRPRSRPPAPARAARSSRSASSTRPRPSPMRCRSIGTPTCCASSGSTSPTTNRSRWSRCGCAADVGADVSRADVERVAVLRPPAAAGRRARFGAPDHHRRDRAAAATARLLACAPGAPLLLCRRVTARRRGSRPRSFPSTAIPPTARRSRSSSRCEQECCNMPDQIGPSTPESLVDAVYARVPGTRRDHARAPRPADDVRGEDPRGACRRSAHRRADARRRLRRLPARPRRDAGRDRADGAVAVHAREDAVGRGSDHRALRSPDPGARRCRRRHAGRARHQPRGLRLPPSRSRRSTASGSGSRAAGSSTRSCSRTTRSRAG